MNNTSSCALPHRFLCCSGHMTRLKVGQRPFLHTSSPFRLPESQRLIEVMRHCMRRVVGIPMSLPGALHTDASQHISTLHNASGTHILRYAHAQVKHPLFATCFVALHTTQFPGRRRVRFDRREVATTIGARAFVASFPVANQRRGNVMTRPARGTKPVTSTHTCRRGETRR